MLEVSERVSFLIGRLTKHPRAAELSLLRRRLNQALDDLVPDAHLRRLAMDLLALREQLSGALSSVRACSRCVQPRSEEWPGGHCCSGSTEAIFTRAELAALKLAGTQGSDLSAPREQAAGCVFRARKGCTLKVAHRPCLCVRYTCRELEAELTARGDRAVITDLQRRLRTAFDAFLNEFDERLTIADEICELD